MNRTVIFLSFVALLFAGCSSENRNSILASGTIEATEIQISSKVGGKLAQLYIDDGSVVRRGDTIAAIDQSDLLIQKNIAEAALASNNAQYQLLLRGSRQEDIDQAEANYQSAKWDLDRITELYTKHSVTKKQLEDAQTHAQVTHDQFIRLKNGPLPEEKEAARARCLQAQAQVAAVSKQLTDATILSPSDGIITTHSVEEGENLLPLAAIARLSDLRKVHLMIYVSDLNLNKIHLGQKASVRIDSEPSREFIGTVTFISSVAEFTPKNVQTQEDRTKLVYGVKVEIPNNDLTLKPGMPADATLNDTTAAAR